MKEQGTGQVVAVGKGAVLAAEPRLEPDEPRSVALVPRKPRIISRSEEPAAQVVTAGPAPARLGMTKENATGLREALADLLWARRILSGSGSSQ